MISLEKKQMGKQGKKYVYNSNNNTKKNLFC